MLIRVLSFCHSAQLPLLYAKIRKGIASYQFGKAAVNAFSVPWYFSEMELEPVAG